MTLPAGVSPGPSSALPFQINAQGIVALEVDPAFFAADAVLRAAYKFTEHHYVFIETRRKVSDRWLVAFHPKQSGADPDQRLLGDFANELIDQQIRLRLEQQFGDVRTLIVAQAFSEGNLLDPTSERGDYQDDPKGIGRLRP